MGELVLILWSDEQDADCVLQSDTLLHVVFFSVTLLDVLADG